MQERCPAGSVRSDDSRVMPAMRPMSVRRACAVAALAGLGLCLPAGGELLMITKGPYLQNPRPDSMTVMWEYTPADPYEAGKTLEPDELPVFRETGAVQGAVRYGTDAETLDRRAEAGAVEASYLWRAGPVETVYLLRCTLEGLSPGTLYYYQVETGGAASGVSRFRTPPRQTDACTFLVYGNSHFADPHTEIAPIINRENPDFLINAGNMVQDGRRYWEWEETFFRPLAAVIDHIPVWPVMGAADWRGSQTSADTFQRLFCLPGNAFRYSFDYGPAHFLCLSELSLHDPETAKWCERDLAESGAPWKIVCSASPPFEVGELPAGADRQRYAALFQTGGVSLHISGKSHFYLRSCPLYMPGTERGSAITYVVTGGAGYKLVDPPLHSAVAAAAKKRHYTLFTVEGRTLRGRAVGVDGEVIDTFAVEKEPDGAYAERYLAGAGDASAATPGDMAGKGDGAQKARAGTEGK